MTTIGATHHPQPRGTSTESFHPDQWDTVTDELTALINADRRLPSPRAPGRTTRPGAHCYMDHSPNSSPPTRPYRIDWRDPSGYTANTHTTASVEYNGGNHPNRRHARQKWRRE